MKYTNLITKCGEVKGIDCGEYNEFRGIKYADAARFEYPEEITSWQGVYDATEFGECAIQHRAYEDDATVNAFYHKEFRVGLEFSYSEDCQFLNIYAPKNASGCPVLIYIHGGSFTGGSTNEGHISGKEYAKRGIIFADMNYRLGAFGFCSHPALRDDKGRCGNFGLYDQAAAISWIKNNIDAFGGNPDSITLLGQSAGAMSVDILMSSPLCKGSIKGAVLMSGAALQRGLIKPVTPEKTEKFWERIMQSAGVSDIEGLRRVDAKTLYEAWKKGCSEDKLSAIYTLPVYDGALLTKECFNMEAIPEMPKIIGITNCDMVPAVLEHLAKKWIKHDKKSADYIYLFDRNLPGDDKGAWHSADLLYAFGTLDFSWRSFEEIDHRISEQLINAICAFVRSGNPNTEGLPEWRRGCKEIMAFSEDTSAIALPTKRLIHNTIFGKGPM